VAIPFRRLHFLHDLGRRPRRLQIEVILSCPESATRSTSGSPAARKGFLFWMTMQPVSTSAPMKIYVAVPVNRDQQSVRSFGTFTGELLEMVKWLQQCRIETVAMEATGVYWIPAHQMLEAAGIRVCLVNARCFQNVPGRKSDVSDCQWLQRLHSVGLLRGSFRPTQDVCVLRSLTRHRDNLIQMASAHILHTQKALDQMNVQLHHVLADINWSQWTRDPGRHTGGGTRSKTVGEIARWTSENIGGNHHRSTDGRLSI
jgi:transposase